LLLLLLPVRVKGFGVHGTGGIHLVQYVTAMASTCEEEECQTP